MLAFNDFDNLILRLTLFAAVFVTAWQMIERSVQFDGIENGSWKMTGAIGPDAEWATLEDDLWFGMSVASRDREGLRDVRLAVENRTDELIQLYGGVVIYLHVRDRKQSVFMQEFVVDPYRQLSKRDSTRISKLNTLEPDYLILPANSTSLLRFDLWAESLFYVYFDNGIPALLDDCPWAFPQCDRDAFRVQSAGARLWFIGPRRDLRVNILIDPAFQPANE